MPRPRGHSWPNLSLPGTSFIIRLGMLIVLGAVAHQFSREVIAGDRFAPNQAWLPYLFFGVAGTLLFAPELSQAIGRICFACLRWLGQRLEIAEDLALRRSHREAGWWSRTLGWLLHFIVVSIKWTIVFSVRLATQPIRAYFYPTFGNLLLFCILHWFFFGTVIWMIEARALSHDVFGSVTVFGQELLAALWHFAVYLVSAGMDGGLPKTQLGRFLALIALVLFLVILAIYGSAIHETRERLNLRRRRGKPKYLPMFGHFLITGDIPAIRMLLHQFESYGACQDVVVATKRASTAAIVGLEQLEPLVWAIEGGLWEEDVRKRANVRHASALVVAGASLSDNDTVRTVLSVEGDSPLVQSAVDARRQDLTILRQALRSKDGHHGLFIGGLCLGFCHFRCCPGLPNYEASGAYRGESKALLHCTSI